MEIFTDNSHPTLDLIRTHWRETDSAKGEVSPNVAASNRELYHYFASSIFAVQMRLQAIARLAKHSNDSKLREGILMEKAKAERELDLCGEILQFAGLEK